MTTKSQKQEHGVAARYGGQVVPRSGAGWSKKHDVRTPTHLLECKYTSAIQFILHLSYLRDLEKQAIKDSRLPALMVEFVEGDSFVVLPEADFYDLIKERDATEAQKVDG